MVLTLSVIRIMEFSKHLSPKKAGYIHLGLQTYFVLFHLLTALTVYSRRSSTVVQPGNPLGPTYWDEMHFVELRAHADSVALFFPPRLLWP